MKHIPDCSGTHGSTPSHPRFLEGARSYLFLTWSTRRCFEATPLVLGAHVLVYTSLATLSACAERLGAARASAWLALSTLDSDLSLNPKFSFRRLKG